jgi:hypothetical protein
VVEWAGATPAGRFQNTTGKSATDLYLFKYLPWHAGEATLSLSVDGEPVYSTPVSVVAGPVSARSLLEGSVLTHAVARQPATLLIRGVDAAGNPVATACSDMRAQMALAVVPEATVTPLHFSDAGVCEYDITFPRSGEYALRVEFLSTAADASAWEAVGSVLERTVAVAAPAAAARIEVVAPAALAPRTHAAAAWCDGAVVMHGGAAAGVAYLSDTWGLRGLDGGEVYRWAIQLVVQRGTAPPGARFTAPLSLDTAAMIAAGQLRSDCADLLLLDSLGTPLRYWLDPVPGCGAHHAILWLQVPPSGDATLLSGLTSSTVRTRLCAPVATCVTCGHPRACRRARPAASTLPPRSWTGSRTLSTATALRWRLRRCGRLWTPLQAAVPAPTRALRSAPAVPLRALPCLSRLRRCRRQVRRATCTCMHCMHYVPREGVTGHAHAAGDTFWVACGAGVGVTGDCALVADTDMHDGGGVALSLPPDVLEASATYTLRGYLRHGCSAAVGAHWMSGGFEECRQFYDVRFGGLVVLASCRWPLLHRLWRQAPPSAACWRE